MRYIRKKDVSLKNIATTIFSAVIAIMLFVKVGLIPLCCGGFYFLFENESDAFSVTGTINSVETVDYNLYARCEAYRFTIDDTACTAIYVNAEDFPFDIGERVKVTLLPLSGYVLDISEAENP